MLCDIRECNHDVVSTAGISFSLDARWIDAVVVRIRDATVCQKTERQGGFTQHYRSQQAYITALAQGNAINADKMIVHSLSWRYTKIRGLSRSTLMVETHDLSNWVETGLRLRAAGALIAIQVGFFVTSVHF